MLLRIDNAPRDYAWGGRGEISALLGRGPTHAIEAELWLGAHSGSPSRLVDAGDGPLDLAAAIAADPSLVGGRGALPFLLKVLAPGAPLSLQAHPNAEQAREGFERENALGIPLDAPHRNYRDPFPKPELIVAASDRFEALAGFRPAAQARTLVDELVAAARAEREAAPLVALLGDDARVGEAFLWLLSGSLEARALVSKLIAAAAADPDRFPLQARLAELHPEDPGVIGSLLLHHVELQQGECLYLPAGNIHAYLDGIGIELMTASDNVLRGGLTGKHIDVDELARVVRPEAGPPPILEPNRRPGGALEYRPDDPAAGFALLAIDGRADVPLTGPAIALCTDGAFELRGAVSRVGLERGEAVFASPEERALAITGSGRLWLATTK